MTCENCERLRELLREYDAFIQSLKAQVRDFNTRDGDYDRFERTIADRGTREAAPAA